MEEKDALVEALEKNNRLLAKHNRYISDWKYLLWRGILMGLGGVFGGTIVVSLLLSVVRPFEDFETLGPAIERLTRELTRE